MAVMELWRRRDLEGAVKPEYIDGNFFTQDSVGNLVGVKVYKNGAEVALTGSVTGYCVLPSGETVSVAGTRSGNQASILVPQSALAYTGPLGITIKLVDGNTITTLMSIIVVVYRSKTDTVITPSSQIITDWANQISAALQEVEDASAAQDSKISDFKSAFGNAIANVVESAAPYVISNVTNFVADDWELGGINATGGEFNATYIMRTKHFYPYNPNCTYTWAGRASDAPVRWAFFYDSDFNYLSRDSNAVLPIRTDAAYLRFSYGYASTSGVTIDSETKATLAAAFGFVVKQSEEMIKKARTSIDAVSYADISRFSDLTSLRIDESDWENGTIYEDSGRDAYSDYTIRTIMYPFRGSVLFTGESEATSQYTRNVQLYMYYANGEYKERTALIGRTALYKVPDDVYFVRFVYGFPQGSGITVESYGKSRLIQDWSIQIFNDYTSALKAKGELESTDIDSLTDPGTYLITNAMATAIPDFPTVNGGTLLVVKPDYNSLNATQIYSSYASELYSRHYVGGTWSVWKGATAVKRTLRANEDLDSITDVGYYAITNAAAKRLVNYPVSVGGVLLVFSASYRADYPIVQLLCTYTYKMVYRIKLSTNWLEWSDSITTVCDTSPYARKINTFMDRVTKRTEVLASSLPYEDGIAGSNNNYSVGDLLYGVLYSSTWREGNDVYWNKTLETYYSALANPASVLYTRDARGMNVYNAHAFWGGVCSTFVSYFLGMPYYMTTSQLADTLQPKDIDSVYEVEVGDILLMPGHIACVSQVYCNASGGIHSIEIAEQNLPVFRKTIVPIENFEKYLTSHNYTIMANPSSSPRMLDAGIFADDIIFEHGNNTYYKSEDVSAGMWFYIPEGTTVYYSKDGGTFASKSLNGVPSKTVNSVTVYNLQSCFSGVGDYVFTTNTDKDKKCLIRIIKCGTASISNGVLTLSGYEKCTPVQYYVVELKQGTDPDGAVIFDPPSGYYAEFLDAHHFIESDSVTLEGLPESGKYKLCIDFETGLGYKRIFSANIGV